MFINPGHGLLFHSDFVGCRHGCHRPGCRLSGENSGRVLWIQGNIPNMVCNFICVCAFVHVFVYVCTKMN